MIEKPILTIKKCLEESSVIVHNSLIRFIFAYHISKHLIWFCLFSGLSTVASYYFHLVFIFVIWHSFFMYDVAVKEYTWIIHFPGMWYVKAYLGFFHIFTDNDYVFAPQGMSVMCLCGIVLCCIPPEPRLWGFECVLWSLHIFNPVDLPKLTYQGSFSIPVYTLYTVTYTTYINPKNKDLS